MVIVGIAGDSGVGKSTISEFIQLFYSSADVKVLCGDDLHKWERGNVNWRSYTHLDANANNLDLGDYHLNQLLNGIPIWRSVYSHRTGLFEPPVRIGAPEVLINEGLHSFYTDFSASRTDVKIYIDTDEALKAHWKIIRDTERRGYKYSEVVDSIKRRRVDYSRCREVQINRADIIVRLRNKSSISFIGDASEVLDIYADVELISSNSFSTVIYDFLKDLLEMHRDYKILAEPFVHDNEYFQGASGNISVKSRSLMVIKPSGRSLSDSLDLSQLSLVSFSKLNSLGSTISDMSFLRTPSMEYLFHLHIPRRYVFHCHSVYTTTLLCLSDSRDLVYKLFKNYNFSYVKYVLPGKRLFESIMELEKIGDIVFLENHGIIVFGDDLNDVHKKITEIENCSKQFLLSYLQMGKSFLEFLSCFNFEDDFHEGGYCFPDSFVLRERRIQNLSIIALNNYIITVIGKVLDVRLLEDKHLQELNLDSAENLRKNMIL